MKTKTTKLNINALVSFGGGLIILSLATKLLHYAWADKFIVSAFVLEAFLFFLMGYQYLTRKTIENNEGGEVVTPLSQEMTVRLEEVLLKVVESSNASLLISQGIISDVGVDTLVAKIEALKKANTIDTSELNKAISDATVQVREWAENIETINRIHLAQINSFRSTR